MKYDESPGKRTRSPQQFSKPYHQSSSKQNVRDFDSTPFHYQHPEILDTTRRSYWSPPCHRDAPPPACPKMEYSAVFEDQMMMPELEEGGTSDEEDVMDFNPRKPNLASLIEEDVQRRVSGGGTVCWQVTRQERGLAQGLVGLGLGHF